MLPNTHPLYSAFFKFADGPPTTSHELNGWGDNLVHKNLFAVIREGRIAVLYSSKDYSSEWGYHPDNKRFQSVDNTQVRRQHRGVCPHGLISGARSSSAARALALVLLAWMIVRSAAPRDSAEVHERTDSRALTATLAAWTLAPEPTSVHVDASFAPAAREREWLRALAGAGVRVSWSGDSIPATAIEVVGAHRSCRRRARVRGRAAGSRTLSDAVGLIDTVEITPDANALSLPVTAGALDLLVRGQHARATAPDSLLPRQVVVLGRAGWEGKLVMAALEERGWKVSSRLRVGPNVFVTQGTPLALDTAHTGAVIALDSTRCILRQRDRRRSSGAAGASCSPVMRPSPRRCACSRPAARAPASLPPRSPSRAPVRVARSASSRSSRSRATRCRSNRATAT